MPCTFKYENVLKHLISGQKTVKGPTTLAQSAQTDKRKFFFLLEQSELLLGAIICAFLLYTKDIAAESHKNDST